MNDLLQATITMLSLVNPAICIALFAPLVARNTPKEKRVAAGQVALATLIALSLSALLGTTVLEIFGISLYAFSFAGGLVLSWIGFAMLHGQGMPTHKETPAGEPGDQPSSPSLTPLIIFAAGPGPITGIITLSAAQSGRALPITALIATAITVLILWVTLLLTTRNDPADASSDDTESFGRDLITRFMGLIIISMGIQIGLTGLLQFFQNAP